MIHNLSKSLILMSALTLVGCSNSDNDNPASEPDTSNQTGSSSIFDSSDAVAEIFGSRTTRNTEPVIEVDSQAAVVSAVNDFSLELHRAVADSAPTEGSIESGYSAAVAFSLASAGTAGNTQSALANMLGVDGITEPVLFTAMNALALALDSRANDGLVLRTANRIFVRPGLPMQNDFLDIATGDFGAPVVEADFAGASEEVTRMVNAWVADQTDDFITNIVDEFSPQTVFVILNAIFLDAKWQEDYQDAGKREFNALDGTVTSVDNFGGRAQLPVLRNAELLALEIPYEGGDIAMLILMPTSLTDFESTLDAAKVDSLVSTMTLSETQFNVPNWNDDSELDLATLLSPRGYPTGDWDFGRMVNGGATLGVVAKQKARIEVDEDGTRAAAVTGLIGTTSAPPTPEEIVNIDRPFVYMIRDKVTGLILFTGRVVSPESD